MGNRAVITTRDERIGVYLHWNGGRDSVEAFLTYCKIRKFRPPEQDDYGWARLIQIIANYFGGDLSIGVNTLDRLDCDNGDNGTYIIENWEIVGRKYVTFAEQDARELKSFVKTINECQPIGDRLTDSEIDDFFERNDCK